MGAKVFILGRPGSGKSTAAHLLQQVAWRQGWNATHFNDYDILLEMFLADKDHKLFRPTPHNGFDAIDLSVLDCALQKLEMRVSHHAPASGLLSIEFARNDYHAALQQFSPAFLKDASILYLYADIDTCLRRVHERVTRARTKDDHPSFSDDIFKRYYDRDNRLYMRECVQAEFGINGGVRVINNTGPLEAFISEVEQFASRLLCQEKRQLVSDYSAGD